MKLKIWSTVAIAAGLIVSCSTDEKAVAANGTATEKVVEKEVNVEVYVVGQPEFEEAMKMENAQLIDVRTKAEFDEGHIDGALNKDFKNGDFERHMSTLDKKQPVLVYCRSGGRSGNCREMLEENGFEKIYDLQGGFSNWK